MKGKIPFNKLKVFVTLICIRDCNEEENWDKRKQKQNERNRELCRFCRLCVMCMAENSNLFAHLRRLDLMLLH